MIKLGLRLGSHQNVWLSAVATILMFITFSNCASISTTPPWQSPCGDPRHAAPSHVRPEFDRLIGTRDVEEAGDTEVKELTRKVTHKIDDIIKLVGVIKNYLGLYFRGNTEHVKTLESLPHIVGLTPSTDFDTTDIRISLRHIYELLTRIAIFTRNMKHHLHASYNIREKTERIYQLQTLEYGGTWRGVSLTSGVYNIMCEIYRVLPSVLNDLEQDIVPDDLSSTPESTAERHNSEYYVIHNIERALIKVKDNLHVLMGTENE